MTVNLGKRPWLEHWEPVDEKVSGGGQGFTSKVRSKSDGRIGCLKRLKNNKDRDRRGRFSREVFALATIDHPNIPKVLEHNADSWKTDVVLYMVSEFIEGPTLSERVEAGVLEPNEAVATTVRLLEVVKHLHDRDVVHRDIKPDNIILRRGGGDPVLVDFGLSYHEEGSFASDDPDQELGNRFLHLPELQTESSDKRNPISDVTQVCGVLLFMLTGVRPAVLRDGENKAPHQRDAVRSALNEAGLALLPIFDIGFQQSTSHRFQSCDELIGRLDRVFGEASLEDPSERIAKFREGIAGSAAVNERAQNHWFFNEFRDLNQKAVLNVVQEIGNGLLECGRSELPDWTVPRHTSIRLVYPLGRPEQSVEFRIECSIIGNEAVIDLLIVGAEERKHIGRRGVERERGCEVWSTLMNKLEDEVRLAIVDYLGPKLGLAE